MSENRSSNQTPYAESPPDATLDWREICRVMLKKSLPLNPLNTQPDGMGQELGDIQISLALLEQQPRHWQRAKSSEDSAFLQDSLPETEIAPIYQPEQFFQAVIHSEKSPHQRLRLGIVGEAGTGKTLMLQKFAHWLMEETEYLPIWISPSQLKTASLQKYLQDKWLPQALNSRQPPSADWQNALEELLKSGRIWLLLDGIDQISVAQEYPLPSSPVAAIAQQLGSWAESVGVVLTCRLLTWQSDRHALLKFTLYQTLEFTYPEGVRKFIKQWFSASEISFSQKRVTTDLGQELCQVLEQPSHESILPWIKNPLRLALLCHLWQQKPQDLPKTKAGLYQQFVSGFYQWKAETLATTPQQQQQLNAALGKLALQAMQTSHLPFEISHSLISETLGEDTSLLRLALQLGWLGAVGVVVETFDEKKYAFFDTTFQDYFAALAIDDWQFFWGRKPDNLPPAQNPYRLFDPQFQATLLLWLGLENIPKAEKEAFIKMAIAFDDGCGIENFYGKRAYFLAAAGLAEFSECEEAETILAQLLKWGLEDADTPKPVAEAARAMLGETYRPKAVAALLGLIASTTDESSQKQALKILEKIGKSNPEAIAALVSILDAQPSHPLRWQAAETLGKIAPGNAQVIATFIQLLESANNEESRQLALSGMEKISYGKGKTSTKGAAKAISALIRLLNTNEAIASQRRVFECLETIGQGNTMAIASLVQLIRTTKEAAKRRQAAESLEKIDPGNPTAIAVLVQLMQDEGNQEIGKQAVYSLGEIYPGNPEGIAALVNLLNTSNDIMTRWVAVSSLGKIGTGNPEAIATLVKLIQTSDQILLCKEAIDSLGKIAPTNPTAINFLVKLVQSQADESICREAAESLGKLDPGNPDAIIALSQLLHDTRDEFTRRQAAASLGAIDPGNLEALTALVQLIQSTQDSDIRSLAAESLGEMGATHPAAIATLIRLIQSTQDKDTLRRATESLGKLGRGNREAIAVLVKRLQRKEDEANWLQIAESLINILLPKQMGLAVTLLKETIEHRHNLACYQLIWHCAQHLPYPEFYQAWHQNTISAQPDLEKTANSVPMSLTTLPYPQSSAFGYRLQQALQEDPDLSQRIHLLGINGVDFLDADNPPVDIYDQMLAQHCPGFEYGIPDTMAKLRLYWHLLQRNHPQKQFVLVFYPAFTPTEASDFSETFLHLLSKFSGSICAVTQHNIPNLKCFLSNNSQLVQSIIDWLPKEVS